MSRQAPVVAEMEDPIEESEEGLSLFAKITGFFKGILMPGALLSDEDIVDMQIELIQEHVKSGHLRWPEGMQKPAPRVGTSLPTKEKWLKRAYFVMHGGGVVGGIRDVFEGDVDAGDDRLTMAGAYMGLRLRGAFPALAQKYAEDESFRQRLTLIGIKAAPHLRFPPELSVAVTIGKVLYMTHKANTMLAGGERKRPPDEEVF